MFGLEFYGCPEVDNPHDWICSAHGLGINVFPYIEKLRPGNQVKPICKKPYGRQANLPSKRSRKSVSDFCIFQPHKIRIPVPKSRCLLVVGITAQPKARLGCTRVLCCPTAQIILIGIVVTAIAKSVCKIAAQVGNPIFSSLYQKTYI